MGFANRLLSIVLDFGRDPNNEPIRSLMDYQVADAQGAFATVYGPSALNPGYNWEGYVDDPPLQNFVHYSGTQGNAPVYRTGAYAQTDSAIVSGPLGNPARRVFAEQLRRRRIVG